MDERFFQNPDLDLNYVKENLDKSVTVDRKYTLPCGSYLKAAKTGRGGRCVFHMDIPCGVTSDILGSSQKVHFKDMASLLANDMLFPEFDQTVKSTAYPGLWGDFMGYSKGFILAAAEYKSYPALYGEHELNSSLHVEASIGFTSMTNLNVISKLLSPKLDKSGKKTLLMEGVTSLMTADLINMFVVKDKTAKIDMLPFDKWFTKKMAGKPPMKPLIMKPFEVPEDAFLFSVKIRQTDHDQNSHTSNCAYIGLAQDAVSSAVNQKALTSLDRSDVDLGMSYCRVFYMLQCAAGQTLNIRVWESKAPLDHKSPTKGVASPSDVEKPVNIFCSMEADGNLCCQTVVRYFDAEKIKQQ